MVYRLYGIIIAAILLAPYSSKADEVPLGFYKSGEFSKPNTANVFGTASATGVVSGPFVSQWRTTYFSSVKAMGTATRYDNDDPSGSYAASYWPNSFGAAWPLSLDVYGPGTINLRGFGKSSYSLEAEERREPLSTASGVGGGKAVFGAFTEFEQKLNWRVVASPSSNGPTSDSIDVSIDVPDGAYTFVLTDMVFAGVAVQGLNEPAAATASGFGGWSASFMPTITPNLTRSQILEDSVAFTYHDDTIEANFAPNGMSVEEAAKRLGVDHFNWVQHVTHIPADWTLSNDDHVVNVPFVDPSARGTITIFDSSANRSEPILVGASFDDESPPYFDEIGEDGNTDNTIAQFTGSQVGFEDRPRFPSGLLGPGEYVGFRTSLVGVTSDGHVVPTGIGFDWKSNTTYDEGKYSSGGIFLSTLGSDGPPTLAGEIYDVVAVVPEPTSFIIAAIGGVLLIVASWRHRAEATA